MLLCCPSTLASSWLKAHSPIPFPRLTRALCRAVVARCLTWVLRRAVVTQCPTQVLRRSLAPRLTRVLRRALVRRRPPAPNPNLRLKQPRKRTQSRGGTIRARRASNSQTVVLCVLAWIRPGGMWQECIDGWAGTRAGTELWLTSSLRASLPVRPTIGVLPLGAQVPSAKIAEDNNSSRPR